MTEHYLLEDVPHKLGATNDSTEIDSGKFIEMTSPMSPSQKLIRLLGSPGRYINRKFSPGSLKGSVFTILASTIGAGILTLPYAMNLVGLYLGIFVFVLGMWVSLYSCNLLVKCADALKISTYEGVGAKLYGNKMGKFCEINIVINNFGTAVAYIVVLKGIFPNALSQFGIENELATNEFLWGTLITTVLIFPLSLCKDISALRYTSFISFLTCSYLAIVVVAEFFILKGDDSGKKFADAPPARFTLFSIFEVFPLVVVAYTCHPNVMPIYDELQRRTVKRGNKFLFRGLLLVMVLYLFVGVFGFLTFYDDYDEITDFPSQILRADYNDGDPLVIIVRDI
jgi:sodium-coupled neutral amino acid transporter 2